MILDEPAGEPRLLSYCTNVHPGETVDEILEQFRLHAVPLRRRFPEHEVFGLGLRLGETAVRELEESPEAFERFSTFLAEHSLAPFTVNVFPQGEFHADRVKEKVYEPDWSSKSRLDYTVAAARVLARLLPVPLRFGTLSTLPLGYGDPEQGHRERCTENLIQLAGRLAELEASTGNRIQLCIEPEPCCHLETTGQTIAFFKDALLARAGDLETVDGRDGESQVLRFLGVCYDACHQAVEFEEASYSFERYRREGIEIGKIQLSCAVEVRRPGENPEGTRLLQRFQEPRFLHQVIGRAPDGELSRFADLDVFLEAVRSSSAPSLEAVRCHFHVPIHAPDTFPIGTTVRHLQEVMNRQKRSNEVLHLEIETYTLDLLPQGPSGPGELVDDLEQEIRFAYAHLVDARPPVVC